MIRENNTSNMKTVKNTNKIIVWILIPPFLFITISIGRRAISLHIIGKNSMCSIKFSMISVNTHVNYR